MIGARRSTAVTVVALGLCPLVLSACGTGQPYANNPRPPAPIVVTAAIVGDHVSLSPAQLGAGPIELVIANETDSSQQATLETDQINGRQAGLRQRTGPINPQDTASLKASLQPGTYSLHVEGSAIKAARLQVGALRASAQNQVLQP
ncbi:MAG TPA: hypothetical protein VGN69_11330 [Solirubrobacteraceae bacterium]|jgi:hypothetical protein|nr:hypothetical protein [Solirubrobacteraceae bacterium]